MLSIIISSTGQEKLAGIKKNIAETSGVEYEIIEIINNGEFGLCKAYNDGATKAVYPYLCFVHDDVLFHTINWGSRIIHHIQDKSAGVIGVAGGCYKSAFGLDWKDGKESFYRANIIDGLLNHSRFYFNPENETRSQVVCLDGLFICCRKEVWEMNNFDQDLFNHFDFYDADFSMQVQKTLNNYVVFDIEIEHFSHGRIGRRFVEDSFLFEKKWRDFLPVTTLSVSKKEIASVEGYVLTKKLKAMKNTGFTFAGRWKILMKYFSKNKNAYQLVRNLFYGFIRSKQ